MREGIHFFAYHTCWKDFIMKCSWHLYSQFLFIICLLLICFEHFSLRKFFVFDSVKTYSSLCFSCHRNLLLTLESSLKVSNFKKKKNPTVCFSSLALVMPWPFSPSQTTLGWKLKVIFNAVFTFHSQKRPELRGPPLLLTTTNPQILRSFLIHLSSQVCYLYFS